MALCEVMGSGQEYCYWRMTIGVPPANGSEPVGAAPGVTRSAGRLVYTHVSEQRSSFHI